MAKFHPGHLKRRRQQVIRQRGVQELALIVEGQFFVKSVADALSDAAVNLAGQRQRIYLTNQANCQLKQGKLSAENDP